MDGRNVKDEGPLDVYYAIRTTSRGAVGGGGQVIQTSSSAGNWSSEIEWRRVSNATGADFGGAEFAANLSSDG